MRRRLFRRRGHIDVRFAVDDGQERTWYVLPRELRVRSLDVTKTSHEAALAFFCPDLLLLALLTVVGRFAREYSGERFRFRSRRVAPPFGRRPHASGRPDDVRERRERHVVVCVITRATGLRFEWFRGVGVLRTRRLHGEECRFRSRF